ncbi:NEAT domain-containing protein [Clostridium tarantellae]|uniref:NEAT domain-containing protein n=1 Tax=Clostridium tarantellae TaxID=39493 RepID=A0A6I1MVT1_9CLOT|nr:NEAT domain-containing protein [Clostridium tarantellae]MPQ44279.1 hypothetical protein [Clostridium tarantellae]
MKIFKRLITMFLINIFIFTNSLMVKAADNGGFKSGIYTVQNDIYHSSETGRSMARGRLDPNMKMEIKNGNVFFTITLSGAQYMSNFRMVVDGRSVEVDTVDKDTNNDTITLKFKANSPSSKITPKIYVGPMSRDVSFNIIPKLETANLIEAIEEPKLNKEISKGEKIKEQVNKENKEETSNKAIITNNEPKENSTNKIDEDSKITEIKKENNESTSEQLNKDKENKEKNSDKQENMESQEVKAEENNIENNLNENKDNEEKNVSNEKLNLEDEGKGNIYERLNKNVMIIILVIGIVTVGGTIFAVKKLKKQHR